MIYQPTKLALAIGLVAATQSMSGVAQNNNVLEEITVYAQKREQSILEVPISVASYSGDSLEQAQVRDLSDLQQVAPSLVFNSSSGATQSIMTIRGIGTAGQNSGLEQSVGVFIDGVYRGRPGSALSDFVDVEAVEVLRGPQGTLFGRNTSAGVISVRTKKPSYEPEADLSVGIGSLGYKQFKGSVSAPIVDDKLAFRLSGTWQEREGYMEDSVTGEEYNDRDRYTVRGQILWDISEDTSLRIIADYTETDEVCCTAAPVFYNSSTIALVGSQGLVLPNFGIGAPMQSGDPGVYGAFNDPTWGDGSFPGFTGVYTDPGDYDVNYTPGATPDDSFIDGGISAEFETALTDKMDFTAIVAHRFFETSPYGDVDQQSADILRGGRGQDIDENSVELRLSYTGDSFDWDAGVYYFDQEIDGNGGFQWGADASDYLGQVAFARFAGLTGAGVPSGTPVDPLFSSLFDFTDPADPTTWYPAAGIEGRSSQEDIHYEAESIAIFGQATWRITDALSWTFGGRYSEEEKEADYQVSSDDPFSTTDLCAAAGGTAGATFTCENPALFYAMRPLQLLLPVEATSDDYDDDNVSVATSLNYEFNDAVSIYGRYAQGYKAGGLNLNGGIGQTPGNPVASLANNQFDSEETESFEVGVKSFLFDRTLSLNATVFYQTVDDFQVNSFDGASFTLQNAGEIEGKGLEIDYSWTPNENWIIAGGLVLQDIEYADFENGSTTIAQQEEAGLAQRALGIVPPQDLTGETPNFVSDVTYAGSVTYLHEINSDLMLRLGTSYRYRSDYTTGQDNDAYTENDDYWIWNANIALSAMDDSWSIELWGKNLTDEEVINIGFDTVLQTGSFSAFMEPPMTWGLTGTMRF